MKLFSFISTFLAATGVALAVNSMPASAVTFGFNNISGGDMVGDAYNSNFLFDVSDSGNNTVLFKFSNTGTFEHAIKQVAFSVDNSVSGLLSEIMVNSGNSGTVDFKSDTNNLPQSNLIAGWDGETFGAKTSGGNNNSVQPGENLGIKFNGDYNIVLSAINTGKLQLGIHVGSLPNGASDSYVNAIPKKPPTQSVPEPTTLLGLVSVGLVAQRTSMLRRRKVSKNA